MKKLHLKLNKKTTAIWTITLSLIILLFSAAYLTMANDSMKMLVDSKLEGLPTAILSIVGFESIPDFTNIVVFYAYIMQYINIALAIFALSLGLASFLQEESDHTIEFLMSSPISRIDFVKEKLIANFILVTTTVVSMIVFSSLGLFLFKPEDVLFLDILKDVLPIYLSFFLIAYTLLIFGSGLSLILKSELKVATLAMAIVFSTYFMGIMASVVEKIDFLEVFSLLHALMPLTLYEGSANLFTIVFWIVLSILTFVFGLNFFKKRDILV